MSRTKTASLTDRQADFTRRLILDAAVELVEAAIDPSRHRVRPDAEVTLRAVARAANISERTMFRYFASRDEFFDALTEEARARMAVPGPPRTIEELRVFPRPLYGVFEAQQRLVLGSMHLRDLYERIRSTQATARWGAVRKLIDAFAPRRSEEARRIVAANINYHLGATSWEFFRFSFGFTLEESIVAAEAAIGQFLGSLEGR
jgi:AcrR family transcriptional regulator